MPVFHCVHGDCSLLSRQLLNLNPWSGWSETESALPMDHWFRFFCPFPVIDHRISRQPVLIGAYDLCHVSYTLVGVKDLSFDDSSVHLRDVAKSTYYSREVFPFSYCLDSAFLDLLNIGLVVLQTTVQGRTCGISVARMRVSKFLRPSLPLTGFAWLTNSDPLVEKQDALCFNQ